MTIGIVAAVLAGACYETGYLLQTLEARVAPAEDALKASLLVRLARRRRWLAGTALSVLGAVLQVVALAHAPVTLVQPILALGLVVLLTLAHFRLGERIGALEIGGAAAVIVGVAAVAISSPDRSTQVTSVPALVVMLAVLAFLALLPFLLRARSPLWLAVAGAAAGDSLAAIAMKLTADALGSKPGLAALAAAGAAAAGLLALTAEMSALRGIPASRVAPVVIAGGVIVPAVAAMVAFGEPVSAGVVIGIVAAGLGAGLLGTSDVVARLRSGDAEPEPVADDRGGAGQLGERVVG